MKAQQTSFARVPAKPLTTGKIRKLFKTASELDPEIAHSVVLQIYVQIRSSEITG